MKHAVLALAFVASLAILFPGQSLSQSAADEAAVNAAAVPVAFLYVQTTKGVYAYAASAAGKITPLNSSPYPVVGAMEDANSKFLISVGNTWLHAYPIESNGGLGKQVGTINTAAYGGSQCGETNGVGSTLDRTGKYLYVYLFLPGDGNSDACAVMQSYQVESNGEFKYLGYVEADGNPQGLDVKPDSIPAFSSNDKFAYALYPNFEDGNYTSFTAFKVASNGDLQGLATFTSTDPQTPGDAWFYNPTVIASDNAGHLAVVLNWFAGYPPPRLASYTIDGSGNLTSTNTDKNMPSLAESGQGMAISPSGKLLAIPEAAGVHLFNFDGGKPITANQRIPIAGGANALGWDNHNHLYVQGNAGLYVYTATPTSVTEVAGSPFKIANGKWILVPKP
jgi:hypothetical protein